MGSSRRPGGNHQRGVSLIGLMFWAILVGFIAYVAIRVLPTLNEYFTIQQAVNKIAAENLPTVGEIRRQFDKQKDIEYSIVSISGKDLDITKENDRVVIRFAYAKELELISDFESGLPNVIIGDAARLRQVLVNLLGNALKFTAQGEVELKAMVDSRNEETGECLLHFAVRDTGIGNERLRADSGARRGRRSDRVVGDAGRIAPARAGDRCARRPVRGARLLGDGCVSQRRIGHR